MIDEDEVDYLRAIQKNIDRYYRKLSQAPDCRDPDHPGCEHCEEEWEDYES